jgi:hypothetical protein
VIRTKAVRSASSLLTCKRKQFLDSKSALQKSVSLKIVHQLFDRVALHRAKLVAVRTDSEQRPLALTKLALLSAQPRFARKPGTAKCVHQRVSETRIGTETTARSCRPWPIRINRGFLKPRRNRLGVFQRFAQTRKAFKGTADHLFPPNKKNPWSPMLIGVCSWLMDDPAAELEACNPTAAR